MMQTLKWKRSNKPLLSSKDKAHGPPSPTLMPSNSSSSSSTSPLHQPVSLSTLSQTTPALAIPEIMLAIAAFLNRQSLTHCALVCKDWNAIFQPLLFRVILAADFDRPDFVHAFQNHTRFATSIEWIQESPTYPPPVPKKSAWHRFFRRRTLSSSSSSSLRPIATMSRKPFEQLEHSLLAGQTPSLETLSVRVQNQDPNLILRLAASTVTTLQISTRGYPARKPRLYMEDILHSYPNLVHLTLEGLFTLGSHLLEERGFDAAQHPYFPAPLPAPPPGPVLATAAVTTTTGLTISSPFPSPSPTPQASSLSSTTHTSVVGVKGKAVDRSSSIESLSLRLVDISQDGLLALSALLPQLKSLLIEEFLVPDMMIKTYRWTWSPTFVRSLRTAFPHLQSLRFAFPFENIKEDTIVEILKSFPLLTTVGFRNAHFGERAMETLQEHCKFVECLDVSFGYGDYRFKAALLLFLQTWPRLRELEADGVIFHLDTPIDAGVMRTPWACTKLEKLLCGFYGTESMIFQHLSQFPMLSHLTIAHPSLTISSIDTTLAWMARSTKMEYFWFTQQRNQVLERDTIQWFLKHWPNLKKLHVAGGVNEQKEVVRQWCRDAQRLSVVVETDRY